MNWGRRVGKRKPGLALQHFGIDDRALRDLQSIIEGLAAEMGAELQLAQHGGDAVLVDAQFARAVPPQLLQSFCADRPLVTLRREAAAPGQVRGSFSVEELRAELQSLLQRLPTLRTAASAGALDSGFESGFDSRYPEQALQDAPAAGSTVEFLRALHQGCAEPLREPLVASYGKHAKLVIDFAHRRVLLEPAALIELRVGGRLPALDAGVPPAIGIQVRELDAVLWDLGSAAGTYPLHQAPADWFHQPLVPVQVAKVARCSASPLHRDMAAAVAHGGVTPAQLRRECRTSLRELRGFLQACLFLGVLRFGSVGAPASTAPARLRAMP